MDNIKRSEFLRSKIANHDEKLRIITARRVLEDERIASEHSAKVARIAAMRSLEDDELAARRRCWSEELEWREPAAREQAEQEEIRSKSLAYQDPGDM